MKTQKLVVATAWMAAACLGGANKDDDHVTVYLSGIASSVDYRVSAQAQGLTAQMFAGIGVKIDWRGGRPLAGQKRAIEIEMVGNAPKSLPPGAMASAMPYEGVHIQIFWDRIKRPPSPYRVLAHVMVHEITHILEGVARHSAEGIMKARWSDDDFGAIGITPLSFAPEDVLMIHDGLKTRNSSAKSTTGQPERTSVTVSGAGK